ncbi:hypothetical protein RugamoR64_55770 [Duganella rhizosphaerae]|uniref:hypothetical protein n=1 Tax=Duganella rhizosphaerae TaxID=2885763 RepID=UPI0030E76F6D
MLGLDVADTEHTSDVRLLVDFGARPGLALPFARALLDFLERQPGGASLHCYALSTLSNRSTLDSVLRLPQRDADAFRRAAYVWAERQLDHFEQSLLWDQAGLVFDGGARLFVGFPYVTCTQVTWADWLANLRPSSVLSPGLLCRLTALAAQWLRVDRKRLKDSLPLILAEVLQPLWRDDGPPDPAQLMLHCTDPETRHALLSLCASLQREANEQRLVLDGQGKTWAGTLRLELAKENQNMHDMLLVCREFLSLLAFSQVETDYLLLLANSLPRERVLDEVSA